MGGIIIDHTYDFELNGMVFRGIAQEIIGDNVRMFYKAFDGYYRDAIVNKSAVRVRDQYKDYSRWWI
jgi:hypothetical protein